MRLDANINIKHAVPSANSKRRGFALIYALLVISILLSTTAAIYTILLKELKISTFGRESEVAFYAAESGAECAYYWVLSGTAFNGSGQITCAGQTVSADSQFTLSFPPEDSPDAPCAVIEVSSGIIRSHGFNTCATTKLRVERGLQVLY